MRGILFERRWKPFSGCRI